jgi:hypothetical protein
MKTITVTRWKHPSTDTALILDGTPDATRNEALQYFEDDGKLVGTPDEMSLEELERLPEFEG